MPNLTDRQRFALRESLCDVLSGYSDDWSASSWDADAVADARTYIGRTFEGRTMMNFAKRITGLVELLGEWPVGYRGEGGWEAIEL